MRLSNSIIFQIVILVTGIFLLSLVAESAESTSYTGWEKDSAYDSLYNYKERDSFKGKVVKFIKVTPLPGMAPGTALVFDEGGEEILVHICPWDYADPEKTGIRKDIKTKISGSWATIEGEDVFMAAKIKQGENFEFKVRLTKDGTPFWTMSPEELAKETSPSKE